MIRLQLPCRPLLDQLADCHNSKSENCRRAERDSRNCANQAAKGSRNERVTPVCPIDNAGIAAGLIQATIMNGRKMAGPDHCSNRQHPERCCDNEKDKYRALHCWSPNLSSLDAKEISTQALQKQRERKFYRPINFAFTQPSTTLIIPLSSLG